MNQWIRLAKQRGVEEILNYTATIERRLDGIVSHADFPISDGKLEGPNNLILSLAMDNLSRYHAGNPMGYQTRSTSS